MKKAIFQTYFSILNLYFKYVLSSTFKSFHEVLNVGGPYMYQDLHVSKSTKIANLNWNSKSEKLSSVNKHVFITVEIFLLSQKS